MKIYDPDIAPDPETWLALSEAERLRLVSDYHDQAGDELPNIQLHAAIHAVVENQLAEGYVPAVEALERLMRDGLSRHDAIHAIGSVLAEHIWTQTRGNGPAAWPGDAYEQALRTLTAGIWRERYSEEK